MVTIQPGAEPFRAAGGPTGVLLLHGFTGSPASMRPWAHHFAAEGFSVALPLLPGHGTTWQEMNKSTWHDWYVEASRALTTLRRTCESVFVAGLSMGGCLALRLAEERADDIDGLILVNPAVTSPDRRLAAAPILKWVIGSVPGIGNDIKKPGVDEYGYGRTPIRALDSMRHLWRVTRDRLWSVNCPVLVFRSANDHVVAAVSTQIVTQHVSSLDVTERVLFDSYHIATLDNDAPAIFAESVDFVRTRARSRHAV